MDIKEIFKSWIIAKNPTDLQKKLALQRYKICNECPSKKIITEKLEIATICGECGCPISKKIFSPKNNPCPLGKWNVVDEYFFLKDLKKDKKTLI